MSSLLPVLQILEHMQGGRRVNRRYARRSEDTEQMSVMDWARWNQNAHPELELLHHCPNGGSRNKAEAVKLKQMGVKAGIPDLCLPVPMGMYNGLYIEMKYDTGRLEDSQKKMLKALAAAGHYCTVCYGAEEAMHDAVIDEMKELIPSFDPEKPTNRQKILICSYVKELYDHRDRMYNNGKITSDSTERIRYAIQSMMLKETLRG